MEKETDWGWTEHAVEMIPFGLLAGFYGEMEIRITKLSEEGFCFRVCAASEIIKLQEKIRICFYDLQQTRYQEIIVTPAAWMVEKRTEFFLSYAVAVQQEDYCFAVRKLFLEYDRYIRLKLEADDSTLAKQMSGYPADEDEAFAESFQQQMNLWFDAGKEAVEKKAFKKGGIQKAAEKEVSEQVQKQPEPDMPEFALSLDHPRAYRQFLNQDPGSFLTEYLKCYPFLQDWVQNRKVKRLYIGNAFCHLLFPEEPMLFALLEKAKRNDLQVTLAFSYVREYQLQKLQWLLENLQKWCTKEETSLEIEVNDWGMAEMLRCDLPDLIPCYGRMLNKRKKDPRMTYKKGNPELLRENSLNAEFYRRALEQKFGIHGFEWESCGYEQSFPERTAKLPAENHLHLPFYQTNTSQYCTLFSESEYGNRGRQHLLTDCDQRCELLTYLYPCHLRMVGRYNSLFGIDLKILGQAGIVPYDPEKTEKFCRENHVERLVVPSASFTK